MHVSNKTGHSSGFTIVELLVALGLLGIIAGMALPLYADYIDRANIVRAIQEIRTLEKDILDFQLGNRRLPDNLGEIGRGDLLDPWKNPYQYLNIAGAGIGQMRKDGSMVPINTDYDLYSMGKDGKSKSPLTAKDSHDDIIRADDGQYVGLASEY